MRGAGTDANVHLVAYGKTKNGEYKKSDEVVLDNKVWFCSWLKCISDLFFLTREICTNSSFRQREVTVELIINIFLQGDNFESGECDKFKIEMADIGKPYKIRVGHDNSGSFAGWHLDRVSMA